MNIEHLRIQDLGLGSRAVRALEELGVDTVERLVALDPSRVLGVSGCGDAVYRRVVSAQKHLRFARSSAAPRSRRSQATFQCILSNTGAWARRCLEELGINTVMDLAGLRLVDFLELDGFGLGTWQEIAAVRCQAIRILGGFVLKGSTRVIADPASICRHAPTPPAVLHMPLFSDLDPSEFGKPRFHAAWCADWLIADLALSVRAFSLCERADIRDMRALLLTRGTTFLEERNSHLGTLGKTHAVVESLLLGGLQEMQAAVDYSSFLGVVDSWLNFALSKGFAPVATQRFRTEYGCLYTYERIAHIFGVTRARVGQVWEGTCKQLRRAQNLQIIERFWNVILQATRSGRTTCEELAAILQEHFRWEEPPVSAALKQLVGMHPGIRLKDRSARRS